MAHRAPTPHRGHTIICCIHDHKANAATCTQSPHSQTPRTKAETAHLCPQPFPHHFSLLLGPSRTYSNHQGPATPLCLASGAFLTTVLPGLDPTGPDESVTSSLSSKTLPPPSSWRERPSSKACLPSPSAPPPSREKMSDSLSQWWQRAGWRGSDSAASRVRSEKSFSCHYPARERLAR